MPVTRRRFRILIAPNAFKESLNAMEAADAIAEGIRKILPGVRLIRMPIADGGDGTLETLVAGTRGRLIQARVLGPLGKRIVAEYGVTGDGRTAIIEMSRASGLALVPPANRNPMLTSSFGTGELIRSALGQKVNTILLGIGGSATVDGGIGALQALGVRFINRLGRPVGPGGKGLATVSRIELDCLDPRLERVRILVACDVDNPLIGTRGAAAVFGPQKGATPKMVKLLDDGLSRLAVHIQSLTGVDVSRLPGAGAAGGISGSFHGLLGAQLRPGSELVFDLLGLRKMLSKVDLVITGEGKIDGQTPFGKGPGALARLAKSHGIPVIGLAGSVGDDIEPLFRQGFSSIFSIVKGPIELEPALRQAAVLLRDRAEQVARTLSLTQRTMPPLR